MENNKEAIKNKIVDVLKTCYDPEIPVDIYELGLIYDVKVDDNNNSVVTMTLTSPMCPVAESLPAEVREKIKKIDELNDVKIDLVWDPPWDQTMMSEEAKLELGMF